jgi:hypothetical protein
MLVATVVLAATVGVDPLQTATGEAFSLQALLARGPVVLVLWNSWLPGADEFAARLPAVEDAAAKNGWQEVVALFQDEPSALGRLPRARVSRLEVIDRRGELIRRFEVTRAPAVVLLDKDGTVRARCGPDEESIRSLIGAMAKP